MKLTVKVADVLDGRTFVTNSGMTVLLKGVTVPSLLSPGGRRARARLEELILHKHVECDDVEDDIEKRLLVEVWVEGEHVNECIRRILASGPADESRIETASSKGQPKKVEVAIDESAFGVKLPVDDPKLKRR